MLGKLELLPSPESKRQEACGSPEVTVPASAAFCGAAVRPQEERNGGQPAPAPCELFSLMPARWQFLASGGTHVGFSFLSSAEAFPRVNSVQRDRLHSKENLIRRRNNERSHYIFCKEHL